MKNHLFACLPLIICFISCSNDDSTSPKIYDDFSGQLVNREITVETPDNRIIKAYLSKPEGSAIDMVLALHGGSPTLAASQNSTLEYAEKTDGGRQFLDNGFAVLTLEYTEFEADGSKADRGFKELVDVLAATDYILNDSLKKHNVEIEQVFAFGHSRGGANALLAGIERKLDAVIGAEPPLDWIRTKDSIVSGAIETEHDLIQNFEISVSNWEENDFVKYSPGLRLEEFKSKFMVISGELDVAVMIGIAEDTRDLYDNCDNCIDGAEFILHENGHTDWAETPGILSEIQDFVK